MNYGRRLTTIHMIILEELLDNKFELITQT